jgi:hypothetical protein
VNRQHTLLVVSVPSHGRRAESTLRAVAHEFERLRALLKRATNGSRVSEGLVSCIACIDVAAKVTSAGKQWV